MIAVFIAGCVLLVIGGLIVGVAVMLADDDQSWRRFDE